MKKTVLTAFVCMLLLTACSDNEAVSVSEPDYCVTGESLAVSEPTYCVTGESLAAVSEADTVTETTTGPNRRNINNKEMEQCLGREFRMT